MGVRADDRPLVAGGQFGRGELVQVVHRADAAVDGVGTDAVLGVHYVVRPGERRPQGDYRTQDPLPHGLALDFGKGHQSQAYARIHVPEEAAAAYQCPQCYVVSLRD